MWVSCIFSSLKFSRVLFFLLCYVSVSARGHIKNIRTRAMHDGNIFCENFLQPKKANVVYLDYSFLSLFHGELLANKFKMQRMQFFRWEFEKCVWPFRPFRELMRWFIHQMWNIEDFRANYLLLTGSFNKLDGIYCDNNVNSPNRIHTEFIKFVSYFFVRCAPRQRAESWTIPAEKKTYIHLICILIII